MSPEAVLAVVVVVGLVLFLAIVAAVVAGARYLMRQIATSREARAPQGLTELEFREEAAKRNLMVGTKPEVLGLVQHMGYNPVPMEVAKSHVFVSSEEWKRYTDGMDSLAGAVQNLAETVGVLATDVKSRNRSDAEFAKMWVERED